LLAAWRRLRQADDMAALMQTVQQRADVDLMRHRPEPGHHHPGGTSPEASTCSASCAPTLGSQPARRPRISARKAALRANKSVIARPRSGRGNPSYVPLTKKMDCFAALAMTVVP